MNKSYKNLERVFDLKKYKKTNWETYIWTNEILITSNKIRIWKKIFKNGYRNFKF